MQLELKESPLKKVDDASCCQLHDGQQARLPDANLVYSTCFRVARRAARAAVLEAGCAGGLLVCGGRYGEPGAQQCSSALVVPQCRPSCVGFWSSRPASSIRDTSNALSRCEARAIFSTITLMCFLSHSRGLRDDAGSFCYVLHTLRLHADIVCNNLSQITSCPARRAWLKTVNPHAILSFQSKRPVEGLSVPIYLHLQSRVARWCVTRTQRWS